MTSLYCSLIQQCECVKLIVLSLKIKNFVYDFYEYAISVKLTFAKCSCFTISKEDSTYVECCQ